jgi:hypothetical protein
MGGESERKREREREREELLRFAKEGMRKDLHGRRREQIRPPTSKRKHPLFGEKNKGVVWWGVWSGFFLLLIFFSSPYGDPPPPKENKNTFFAVFSFWQFRIIVKMAMIHMKI